jgi:hypothetical protein
MAEVCVWCRAMFVSRASRWSAQKEEEALQRVSVVSNRWKKLRAAATGGSRCCSESLG